MEKETKLRPYRELVDFYREHWANIFRKLNYTVAKDYNSSKLSAIKDPFSILILPPDFNITFDIYVKNFNSPKIAGRTIYGFLCRIQLNIENMHMDQYNELITVFKAIAHPEDMPLLVGIPFAEPILNYWGHKI